MPAHARPPIGYERRRPEETVLYEVLAEHLETFLARTEEATGGRGLPGFVKRELRGFLRCGVLAHGFGRLWCPSCHDDLLVGFSCRGRGFCPSCLGRRMVDTAAHLVDRVVPQVPVRHWVLSFPYPLRYRLAYDAELVTAVLGIWFRAVSGHYRRKAKLLGIGDPRCGAVTVVQRAGDGLRLNPHLHSAFLDGVYSWDEEAGEAQPTFRCMQTTDEDVARVVATVGRRVIRLLVRRGLLPAEHDHAPALAAPDEDAAGDPLQDRDPLLAACYEASVQARVATGERAGAGVRRHGRRSPRRAGRDIDRIERKGELCARIDGFDLHARQRIKRHRRADLERVFRYMLRPPLATDRLYWKDTDKTELMLELKRPWSDGTWALVMSPMELIEKLAPLIPPVHANQVRYHGVLAPGAAWRKAIISTLAKAYGPGPTAPDAPAHAHASPQPRELGGTGTESIEDPLPALRPRKLGWAQLLRRVLGIDVVTCTRCGSKRQLIAFIQRPAVARQILVHLGLPHQPPPIAPARAPPQHELDLLSPP